MPSYIVIQEEDFREVFSRVETSRRQNDLIAILTANGVRSIAMSNNCFSGNIEINNRLLGFKLHIHDGYYYLICGPNIYHPKIWFKCDQEDGLLDCLNERNSWEINI